METANLQREIEAQISKYLIDNYLPRNTEVTLHVDENLFDAAILDSAGLLSFVVYLENKFGLTIPDEDLLPENFSSLAAISNYIFEKARGLPEG